MKTVAILLLLCSSAAAQCGNFACRMCYPRMYRTPPLVSVPTVVDVQRESATTPANVVDEALRLLELTTEDVLLDPGCGDGQLLITACRRYGCLGIGIEIDAGRAQLAQENVRLAEMADRIDIYRGDSRKCWLGNPTAAYLYMPPETTKIVVSRLTCRLVSYSHPIDSATTVLAAGGQPLYVRYTPATPTVAQWIPLRTPWVSIR